MFRVGIIKEINVKIIEIIKEIIKRVMKKDNKRSKVILRR